MLFCPACQVGGTLGHRLANGTPGQQVQVDNKTQLEVKCQVWCVWGERWGVE